MPQQVVEVGGVRGPLGDAAVAEEALDALGGRRRGLLGEDRAEDGVGRGRGAVGVERDEAGSGERSSGLPRASGREVGEGAVEAGSEDDPRVRGPHLRVGEHRGEAARVDVVHAPILPGGFRLADRRRYGRDMTVLRFLGRVLTRVIHVLGKFRMVGDGQNPANGDPMGFDKPQQYRP